jgi:transposase
LQSDFVYFAGIDWGSEQHRVCLMDAEGAVIAERWVEHNGRSLAELVDWLRQKTSLPPQALAAAIEIPRGAFVLADSLRTDMHCFRAVQLDEPILIRLRELSRLEDELGEEFTRVANRLLELFHRFLPQLLQLSEAASEHALLLLPRLRLLQQQRVDLAKRVQGVLDELAAPADGHTQEHRDAAILLSLPGLGRKVAATMLSEAAQAIAERDYHALRCYSGAAPITRQSGKKKLVTMHHGCNQHLRNALYHWSRKSILWDPKSKKDHAEQRASGKSHGGALRTMADRWLKVLVSMLRHNTLYDVQLRAA